ncbi:MAG: VWA domain-containing protein [Clostridia bacterium]|nr:VWA domain-containing protein [Clostridia bacterium]
MPSLSELEKPPRRAMHIFYVLDTSGSMQGASIAQLNRAMEETVEALKDVAKSNADAELKIAVLEFSSGCKWIQPKGPEDMEDFVWEDLTAGGLTDVGAALKELDSKMSRNAFLSSMTGSFLPLVIFMTDGYATDDYVKPLETIRKNKWFARATKIGFAIGDNPDINMIADVVGNGEAVVKTSDLEVFAKMIKFASVTSSMLNSTSRTTDEGATGADVVKTALNDGTITKTEVATGAGNLPEPPAIPTQDDDVDDEWL